MKYRTPKDFAYANPAELEQDIRPTGFFRNKTKSIIGASKKIVEEFGGEVPRTMEELLTLPGVARKTANVVLGTAFGIAVGVVVDTHVIRLSNRLDLSRNTDPKKIEQDLMQVIPQEKWILFSHQLIWHGRKVCQARKPQMRRMQPRIALLRERQDGLARTALCLPGCCPFRRIGMLPGCGRPRRRVGYSRSHAAFVREGRSKPHRGHHPSEISSAWIFRPSHRAEDFRHRSGGKAGFRRRRIRARRTRGNRAAPASPGRQLPLVGTRRRKLLRRMQ